MAPDVSGANRAGFLGDPVNAHTLRNRVAPLLIGGTRREALPAMEGLARDGSARALQALSLVAQALRFERPPLQTEFTVERWPHDERRIVSAEIRSKLVRLLLSKSCADPAQTALAFAFARYRLRPHPFDFPDIGAFISKFADYLGVSAQHWALRDTVVERRNEYFDADDLSEKNWTEAPRARRAQFLEELRARDANAARELLAAVWAREDAETRVRLLLTMQTGLSADDKTFLRSMEKDRAPRVRILVQRLIARLPGETGANPALHSCLTRIHKSQKGKLRKRPVLKLELPATVKEQTATRWVHDEFQDVSFEELAGALTMSSSEMIDAAEVDTHLLFALALMASREKQFDRLASITALAPDLWGRMSSVDVDEPLFSNAGERDRWAAALIHPEKWTPENSLPAWSWLLRRMEGPLPAAAMDEFLTAKWWKEALKDDPPPHTSLIQVVCALCPPSLRARLREQIDPLPAERKDEGWLLMEILDRLENFA